MSNYETHHCDVCGEEAVAEDLVEQTLGSAYRVAHAEDCAEADTDGMFWRTIR